MKGLKLKVVLAVLLMSVSAQAFPQVRCTRYFRWYQKGSGIYEFPQTVTLSEGSHIINYGSTVVRFNLDKEVVAKYLIVRKRHSKYIIEPRLEYKFNKSDYEYQPSIIN